MTKFVLSVTQIFSDHFDKFETKIDRKNDLSDSTIIIGVETYYLEESIDPIRYVTFRFP